MPTKGLQEFVLMPPRYAPARRRGSLPASTLFLRTVGFSALNTRNLINVGSLQPDIFPLLEPSPPLEIPEMRVIDSTREDGPKLVEMSAETASCLRALQPGLRLAPVLYYGMALSPRPEPERAPQPAAKVSTRVTIKVVSKKTGEAIAGAKIIGFTNFAQGQGSQGTTNNKGQVLLSLPNAETKFQRLYIYPPKQGYWGLLKRNVTVTGDTEFALEPVDLSFRDALRTLYPPGADQAGAGVTIAVVDSGIAPHPDLAIDGGFNAVPGEDPRQFGDNGVADHGTHVAGIICARGTPPRGLRGLAPAAKLRSYRAYAQGERTAKNYVVGKAIDQAVDDHCDLINLSMYGGPADEVLVAAIARANANGCVVIAAAGNDSDTGSRKGVTFPANDSQVLAVSAMGRTGTWAARSVEEGDVAAPHSSLSKTPGEREFIARFSNVGKEIDFTAPGVGILSTVPGGYAPMSGTSMACPAVTGAAAGLLSGLPELLGMARDQARAEALAQAIFRNARPRGFEAIYEGLGLLMLS
jgi:subtilisin